MPTASLIHRMSESPSKPAPTTAATSSSGSAATPRPTARDIALVSVILLVGTVAMLLFHRARSGGDFSRLLYGDERSAYLPAAEAIRQDGLGFFLTDRSLWTGPLNPLWLAVLGGRIALIKVANIALFLLAGLALWDITRRIFSNRAGFVAVAFYATYPPFFKFTPTLLTEPLFVPMVIFALWFVVIEGRYGTRAVWASGFLLGLATLTRPTLQLFPLFLLGVWAFGRVITLIRRNARVQIEVRKIILIGAAFAIVVAPYAIKNLVALDKLGIANGSGAVLYIGNDLRTHGYEPIDSNLRFSTQEISTPYTHLDTEGDSLLLHAALERIGRDPLDVALLQPSKALRLVFGSPGHYFRPEHDAIEFFRVNNWIDRLNLLDLIVTPLLVVVGITGLIAIRTTPFVRLVFGSFVTYMILVNTLLFPIPRMFLAALPVLMIFTAGALTQLPKRSILVAAGGVALVVLFIAFKGVFGTTGTVSESYVAYFDPVVAMSTDRWLTSKDAQALSDGSVASTGPDPYIVFDVDDFEASVNQMVFVTIRAPEASDNSSAGSAQLFWRTESEGFAEATSQLFELQTDGEFHIYALSPSLRKPWSGVISEIRLDLPDEQPNRAYELSGIDIRK